MADYGDVLKDMYRDHPDDDPEETKEAPDLEQTNLVQLVVNVQCFGRRHQAHDSAARVRDILRVALHQPDLKVQILGINPGRPWEGDEIKGKNPE